MKITLFWRSIGLAPLGALALFGAVNFSGCGGEKFATDNTVTSGNTATGGPSQAQARVEPPSQPGKYGGTLTDVTISDPKTFNLWVSAETSSSGVVGPLYDALLGRNTYTLEWEGRLAELPTMENGGISKNGLTWTFKLKPDLKWSDGRPLTADDVIFTLDMIYDPNTQGIMREGMLVDVAEAGGKVKRVPLKYRKVDAQTIEFKFPQPYAPARDMLSFPIAPRHKLEAPYKAGRINSTWGVNTSPRELVSCGTWVMQSYVPGQRVVYTRNPHYWERDAQGRPLPYLERYVLLIVPDMNAMTLKFRSGETDTLSVPQPDYPLVKKEEKKGNYTVHNLGPGWGFTYLGFNMNPEAKVEPWKVKLFQEQKFRQAVSHAINRERISSSLFLGLAQPQWGPQTPANAVFYNPDVPKYSYDLNKAKALLAEVGLKDSNNNGVLEYGGREVRFNIITNVENPLRKAMATIITNDLNAVGLKATFTPINFNKLVAHLDSKPYQWEAVVLGFTGGPEPHNGSNIWFSSGPSHQWRPNQKTPATPWEAEIDKLFREGAQTLDEAKRKEIYNRWQVIAAEQLPFIFLVVPDSIVAVRNGFGNLKPVSGGGALWNIEEIYDLNATRDRP